MSNLMEDFALAKALREKLATLESRIARESNRSPLTRDDEAALIGAQVRADEIYMKAGRKAPAYLPLERPAQYRRRMANDLKVYSPRLNDVPLENMQDDAFAVVENMIYADAAANCKAFGLRNNELRELKTMSDGGHRQTEWVGGPEAWFGRAFAAPVRRATLKSAHAYELLARDSVLARVEAMARHAPLAAPRAAF